MHTRLLVDLDGGLIGFDTDDLSDERVMADTDLPGLSVLVRERVGGEHLPART